MAEIRGHLESNERYRALFKVLHGVYPDERKGVDKWGDTEINIAARRKKAKEPNLSCSGVGVTKVGMHYDVIMSDDLHSEKNVTTKEQIQQVIDHYKLNLSLLEPTGFMTVIGTRWDYLDLYQYLIDNEKHRFCVYAQQAERQGGELLFPERLTAQFLKEQRMSQGSSIYSMQYQNLPIDDETATFKYSQMKKVDESFVKDMPINWFLLVDPAISQESTADDTAFVVAGFDLQRNIYLKDIVYGKFMPSEIIDQIFYLYEKHHLKAVGIESVAFQKTLIYSVNDKMRERNWAFPIKEVKRKSRSKEDRIKGLQPYYENGRVYHLRNCPNINELEYQLIHFPKGRKDDICFVAGTRVITDKGNINIEHLKPGDMVLTRKGFKEIIHTSHREAEVITNLGLTGTPNHPIITKKGTKELEKVSSSDIIYIWNEKQSSIMEKSLTDTQTLQENNFQDITGDTQLVKNRQYLSIGQYGLTILGKYLKDLLSTTKMGTRLITNYLTLNLLNAESTCPTTCGNYTKTQNLIKDNLSTLIKLEKKPKNGTPLQKEESGTANTQSGLGKTRKIVYNIEVSGAHEYFANNILVHNCDAMADILEIGYPPDSRQKNISKEDREKRRKLFKSLSKPRSRVTNY
jgi:predicted phage terminase large subunit-like protein